MWKIFLVVVCILLNLLYTFSMDTKYEHIKIDHVVGTCVGHWDALRRKFRKPYKVNMWRYLIDGAHVGPQMATRAEAFAGLDDYGTPSSVPP